MSDKPHKEDTPSGKDPAAKTTEPQRQSVLSQAGLDITKLAKDGKLEKIAGWDEKVNAPC